MSSAEEAKLVEILMKQKLELESKLELIKKQLRTLIQKRWVMLMHIISLTEDDSYEYGDMVEQSDAYINIHMVESVLNDDENEDRCFVYMQSEDYFYVNESADAFIARYQSILYGSVLTKFYDRTNKSS